MIDTVLANPDDPVLRLAYADWLDETGGDSKRAALIRSQYDGRLGCSLLFENASRWLAPFAEEVGAETVSWDAVGRIRFTWWLGFPGVLSGHVIDIICFSSIIRRHWPVTGVRTGISADLDMKLLDFIRGSLPDQELWSIPRFSS